MDFPQDIKAVLLDMDGTLLNTEPLHAQALKLVLDEQGLNLSVEEIDKKYYGVSDTQVYAELKLKISLEIFLEKKNKHLLKLISELSQEDFEKLFSPGVATFIGKLNEKKISLALVSASEREVVSAIFERLPFKNVFKTFVARQDTHFSKPFPSPYFFALRRLGVKSSETLIFEDSPSGLRAALSTGARVIQVTTFSPPLKELTLLSLDNFLRMQI